MQVWLEYGLLSARQGNHGRAQQCFREVLELEPSHSQAQLFLGCLLWHSSIFTDSAYGAEASIWLENAAASPEVGAAASAVHQCLKPLATSSSDETTVSRDSTCQASLRPEGNCKEKELQKSLMSIARSLLCQIGQA